MSVVITSFGYLHGPPPAATIVLDSRVHYRDPHLSPVLRGLTAQDARVRDAVMATPGIPALVDATTAAVAAFTAGPCQTHPVTIAVGCAGGRHRAASVAMALESRLPDVDVFLVHRDLDKPVVNRR